MLYKKPITKAEEEDKAAAEEKNELKSLVDILIEFGLDSTIQGLNYIFYPSQARPKLFFLTYEKPGLLCLVNFGGGWGNYGRMTAAIGRVWP